MVASCVPYVDGSRVLVGPASENGCPSLGVRPARSPRLPDPGQRHGVAFMAYAPAPTAAPVDEPLRVATAPPTMRTQDVDYL